MDRFRMHGAEYRIRSAAEGRRKNWAAEVKRGWCQRGACARRRYSKTCSCARSLEVALTRLGHRERLSLVSHSLKPRGIKNHLHPSSTPSAVAPSSDYPPLAATHPFLATICTLTDLRFIARFKMLNYPLPPPPPSFRPLLSGVLLLSLSRARTLAFVKHS